MATTTKPTVKTVIFSTEDKYRKRKMVARLKARDMLSSGAENYILKGRR
jgi:hypothetical protein